MTDLLPPASLFSHSHAPCQLQLWDNESIPNFKADFFGLVTRLLYFSLELERRLNALSQVG